MPGTVQIHVQLKKVLTPMSTEAYQGVKVGSVAISGCEEWLYLGIAASTA